MSNFSRRKLITTAIAATAGGTAAAGIADYNGLIPPDSGGIFGPGETLTYVAQRLLTGQAHAREFPRTKISKSPYPNGKPPKDDVFRRLESAQFADWKLTISGMVERPASFSLAELKALPASTQITQLACEEGWTYIAEWYGVQLSHLLKLVGASGQAKYVVYGTPPIENAIWDSIDIQDALHPQTLISYGMNGTDLPVPFGGPLRIRVPRQLGYKSVKYLASLTVTDKLSGSGGSDSSYSWYAGI